MTSRSLPTEYFLLNRPRAEGPVIARLDGRAVQATMVDAWGRRYQFAGIARRDRAGRLDVLSLGKDEWIVQPDLIYVADEPG